MTIGFDPLDFCDNCGEETHPGRPCRVPEIEDIAEPGDSCTNPGGHSWVCTGTAYGGDDERWCGEGRSYCEFCGADGDA